MKKIVLLIVPATMLISCASDTPGKIRDKFREGRMFVERAEGRYEELRKEYLQKRQLAIKIAEIARKNKDAFSEEEWSTLTEIWQEAKETDNRLRELDEKIQSGFTSAKEYLRNLEEFFEQLQDFSANSEALLGVLRSGLQVTGQLIERRG